MRPMKKDNRANSSSFEEHWNSISSAIGDSGAISSMVVTEPGALITRRDMAFSTEISPTQFGSVRKSSKLFSPDKLSVIKITQGEVILLQPEVTT